MAGDDHGRHLVAQLAVRERRTGLGVARREQHVEQVARLVARRLALPCREHLVHQRDPAPAKSPAGKVARRGNADRQHQVEEVGAAEVGREALDHPPQRRAVAVHLEGEHRARRDLEGEELHRRQHVDRLRAIDRLRSIDRLRPVDRLRRGIEPRQRGVGDLDDVARQHRDDARRERRRDGAALVAPFVALAQEQTFAGDRPQDADGGAGAPVVLDVVHQHAVDRVGRIEQEAFAAEEGLLQHVRSCRRPAARSAAHWCVLRAESRTSSRSLPESPGEAERNGGGRGRSSCLSGRRLHRAPVAI